MVVDKATAPIAAGVTIAASSRVFIDMGIGVSWVGWAVA
jgi:hypothetical protein